MHCPRGHALPASAPRCMQCWGELALDPPPKEIGGYEVVETLGSGSHGTVYRARQRGGKEVALKQIRSGTSGEIANLVRLEHPNVVQIFDTSGFEANPPWFTMQRFERTLRDVLAGEDRERWRDPQRALQLLIVVADAIEHAHARLVLHRDLKPSNILLDPRDRPHVSDFSVATRLDTVDAEPDDSAAGTLAYMSPEQAGAVAAPVTTASDVYGLGAILYELLSGAPPRRAASLDELRVSFQQQPAPAPLRLGWAWADLEAVCLRALHTDPQARYRSAALLAEDLGRVQRREPVPWLRQRSLRRFALFAARHPRVAAWTTLGALLLVAANVVAWSGVLAQQAELRELLLQSNAAFARAQASAALAELDELRDRVSEMVRADHAEFVRLLEQPRVAGAELRISPSVFDSLFVAGCDGLIRSHSFDDEVRAKYPTGPPGYYERNFAFRDYFRGAMALAARGSRDVYVSRGFRSMWDQRFKFGLSTPIYAPESSAARCLPGSDMIGVFLAARSASSTLGELQIPRFPGSGQRTALFGPRDRDRPEQPLPPSSDLFVLVHERLRLGDERRVDPALSHLLVRQFGGTAEPGQQFVPARAAALTSSKYRAAFEADVGAALGGFYPVGRTGFVVSAETDDSNVGRLVSRSLLLLVLLFSLFMYFVLAVWGSSR